LSIYLSIYLSISISLSLFFCFCPSLFLCTRPDVSPFHIFFPFFAVVCVCVCVREREIEREREREREREGQRDRGVVMGITRSENISLWVALSQPSGEQWLPCANIQFSQSYLPHTQS